MIGEIRFDMGTLDFSGKTVGALYVYPAAVQPVIFTNRKGDISSGDIYYRYNGANLKIGPTELQQIIENRVAAPRLMAFIAVAVAAIFGRASCGQYGFDGLQWPV